VAGKLVGPIPTTGFRTAKSKQNKHKN
jgi:hypothetical protein